MIQDLQVLRGPLTKIAQQAETYVADRALLKGALNYPILKLGHAPQQRLSYQKQFGVFLLPRLQ
ncbi:MAG TPA: hypothetical protein DDY39_04910 [Nitrospira sp.]|nr:hypothetical protein [Nitrospira sp.]